MSDAVKRILDVVIATIVLTLASPVLLLVWVLVRIDVGSPALFVQDRGGLGGGVFPVYKFRTMRDGRDDAGRDLPDEERLTAIGRFLRASSLDELPSLVNVIKGDMSLVGPRPLRADYLPLYDDHQARRHEVRPGITGWVQVNGRNSLTWDEKFDLDVWYVENRSLLLDLRILVATVAHVLTRRGISQEGHATMPYLGSSEAMAEPERGPATHPQGSYP
jgi:lipopolysaccharide/colanic/teichoic acid biosynthesis glycosyltransferase